MNITKKSSVLLIVFVVFVSVIFFVNEFNNDGNKNKLIHVSLGQCNVQLEKCLLELDGLNIEISLDKTIEYLKPFDVSVLFNNEHGTTVDSIYIDFKMKNMNMGLNRFSLKKNIIETTIAKQLWSGKAVLPVCITGRADWISELEVISQNKKYILSFPIDVNPTKK